MNTGTSINFDANALQSQDEAEFQKEEQQQLEELRELLSNALDNLTEDGLSVSSNDDDEEGELSREGSFKSVKKQRLSGNTSFEPYPVLSSTFPGGGTVNKQNGELPSNKSLSNTLPGNTNSNNENAGQPYNLQQDLQQESMYYPQYHYLYPTEENNSPDSHSTTNYNGHNHAMFSTMPGGAHPGHHYGVVQGGVIHETGHNRAENDQWMSSGSSNGYYQENFRPDHLPVNGAGNPADYYSHIPNSMPFETQSFVPSHMQPYPNNGSDSHSHPHRSPPAENPSIPTSAAMEVSHPQTNGYTLDSEHQVATSWDQLNGYKVQYRKTADPVLSPQKNERPHNVSTSCESSPIKAETNFIRIGGSSDQKGLAQLQILYKARGRKLEELTEELASVKQENCREIRLLQHKITSTEGECEALTNNLKQCQDLLREAKSDNTQLVSRMETSEALIQALSKSKEELVGKLVSAEAAVESLNHQLKELGKSETLERARQQHDSIVESLHMRHQKEVVRLKEEIDQLTLTSNSCKEEVVLLKRQLADALKNVDDAHISKAETINRLTHSLEESQRQNQYLLQTSQSSLSNHQIVELKNRLQQAESAKVSLEGKCDGFLEEVKSLKQQLSMFESASSLGVFSQAENQKHNSDPEDSFQELAIKKKLNFASPETTVSEDSGIDSQLIGLKHELQRCLTNNREKQTYIEELKSSVKYHEEEVGRWKTKCAEFEAIVQDLKQKPARLISEHNENTESVEILEKEVVRLEEEKEELVKSLRQSKEKENWLESKNKEFEERFAKVSKEHEDDKAEALEHCKKSYETFQDDVKERVRLDLQLEFDEKQAAMIANYEKKMSSLSAELEATLQREDNVKEMYVCVCQEKSRLEDQLLEDYKKKLEVEIGRLKQEYSPDKPGEDKPEMKNVEIQCGQQLNQDESIQVDPSFCQETREQLLAEAREEVAKERAQELVTLRREITDSLMARKSQETGECCGEEQKQLGPGTQGGMQQENVCSVSMKEDQINLKLMEEKIKAEVRAEFELQKQEEWKLYEAELKQIHLNEIKVLQEAINQKTTEAQLVGPNLALLPSQSLDKCRLDEKQRVKSAVDAAKVEWQLLHKAKVEAEVKKQLNIERDQWQKEKAILVEKERVKWQRSANEERKKLVASAVDVAHQEWLKSLEEERKMMFKSIEVERAEMKRQQTELVGRMMSQLKYEYQMSIQAVKNNVTKYMSESNARLCHLVYGNKESFDDADAVLEMPFRSASINGWKETNEPIRETQRNNNLKSGDDDDDSHDDSRLAGSFVALSCYSDSCMPSVIR